MDRRTFLGWTTAGAVGGFAGCTGARPATDQDPTSSPAQPATDSGAEVTSVAGVELPVPKSKLTRGAAKDAIPAITKPAFGPDWSGVDTDPLQADDTVIGLVREGEPRAYPLRILNWHEIVNDTFHGPVGVTYCPLCGSALAARRTVNDEATIFGVSGFLWNSDLVMYDELTGSLWSQIAATAIRGPKTGERLSLVPARLTTWQTWHQDHPETTVLLPPPKSVTVRGEVSGDYGRNPYSGYDYSERIGIGANEVPESDTRLHPKSQVLGIAADGNAKAYPLDAITEAGVVNDTVGDLPVVVTVASDDTTLVAYIRRVDGQTLRFEKASATHLRADGSRWKITTGQAVEGPHDGTVLEPAAKKPQMFWFAWLDFHPDTTVYT